MTVVTNADKQYDKQTNIEKLVEKAEKEAKKAPENPDAIGGLVTVRSAYKSPRDGGMTLLAPCPNCRCARYSPCTCTKKTN